MSFWLSFYLFVPISLSVSHTQGSTHAHTYIHTRSPSRPLTPFRSFSYAHILDIDFKYWLYWSYLYGSKPDKNRPTTDFAVYVILWPKYQSPQTWLEHPHYCRTTLSTSTILMRGTNRKKLRSKLFKCQKIFEVQDYISLLAIKSFQLCRFFEWMGKSVWNIVMTYYIID